MSYDKSYDKTLSLDLAIQNARDNGVKMLCQHDTYSKGKEQLQLAKWLEELKQYRKYCRLPEKDQFFNT